MSALTPAQARALDAVARFGDNGEGWAEVELQFECNTPNADKLPAQFWASLCVRVFGALERKGLITRDADGPRLTAYGKALATPGQTERTTMSAREMLREVADRLHADKPHVCDVLCAEDGARAAALRALADRLDAEFERAKYPAKDATYVAANVLARLDAPPVPPPPPCASWCGGTTSMLPPQRTLWFNDGKNENPIFCTEACRDAGKPLCPAKPPTCDPWCGEYVENNRMAFCTPACRDAGAPRNPVKPCETCGGARVVTGCPDGDDECEWHRDQPCPACTPGAKP